MSASSQRIEVPAKLVNAPAVARRLYPYEGFGGASVAELQVLVLLAADGATTINAIADRLALDPSRTSHTARGLRVKGHVVQRVDDGDRRRKTQALTAKGRKIVLAFIADARARVPDLD